MSERFNAVLTKMNQFIKDPTKRNEQFVMEILRDPLYKEFKKSLSAPEALRHPLFMDFLKLSKTVLMPAVKNRVKNLLEI